MASKFLKFESVPPATTIEDALQKISKELYEKIQGSHLTIIDKYFLKISDEQANHYSEVFAQWIQGHNVSSVRIFGEQTDNNFRNMLQTKCSNSVSCVFLPEIRDIHDRYWIVTNDYCTYSCVAVGTSLNGLGKRYCTVNRLSDADTKALVTYLGVEKLTD